MEINLIFRILLQLYHQVAAFQEYCQHNLSQFYQITYFKKFKLRKIQNNSNLTI